MTLVTLYLATAVIFIVLDALMLRFYMQPLFADRIGGLMTDQVRWLPAALFYMGYLAGVLYLVSLPALKSGMPVQALLGGMVLGAVAYGTYEFTNYAILRDWHWQMVVSDTVWGAVLTGLSAWGGLLITRAVAP